VLPVRMLPPLFRNVTDQLAHVGERLERHHLRDGDRPGIFKDRWEQNQPSSD
jgi:hypothetical protein